jgi:CheY-like chemotaxis protein
MRKLKILIIDNDEDEQFFIKKGFMATDLFDITAILNNGQDLISNINNLPDLPDVILSDLNMPGKNGFEIIEELKSESSLSHIPIVITTNATSHDIREECLKLGAFDVRGKPENFLNYELFAKKLYDDVLQKPDHLLA